MPDRQKSGMVLFSGLLLLFFLLAQLLPAKEYKKLKLKPSMSLAEMQAVIDGAEDGDHIIFKKGTYDFSSAEFGAPGENKAALKIIDKSLVLEAEKDVLIRGAMSEVDGNGIGIRGITAFLFVNLACDKDVVFRGLTLETFLMGICSGYNITPTNGEPSARNVTFENCTLRDIHRNAVVIGGAAGDINVSNCHMESRRIGLFIDWYYNGIGEQPGEQPSGTMVRCLESSFTGALRTTAVILQRAGQFTVTGNTVTGQGNSTPYGIYAWTKNYESNPGMLGNISNNTINSVRDGIILDEAQAVQVSQNTMQNISQYGVFLTTTLSRWNAVRQNNIQVNGAQVWNEYEHYYGIITNGLNNVIDNNLITGMGSAAIFFYGQAENNAAAYETASGNDVLGFAHAAAYYIFANFTHHNMVHDASGASWLNYGDASNQFLSE